MSRASAAFRNMRACRKQNIIFNSWGVIKEHSGTQIKGFSLWNYEWTDVDQMFKINLSGNVGIKPLRPRVGGFMWSILLVSM